MNDNETPQVRRLSERDVLTLPLDTTALDERALEIASHFLSGHAVRVELAAICHLRKHGTINGRDLYELACLSGHTSLQSDDEFVTKPVFIDGLTVWNNLEKLVAGESVTFPAPPEPQDPHTTYIWEADAYEEWREGRRTRVMDWFRAAMSDLRLMMIGEQIYSFDVTKYLPQDVRTELFYEHRREIFGGLLSTGASLHFHAVGSAGGMAHGHQSARYFAEALARALRHATHDYKVAKIRIVNAEGKRDKAQSAFDQAKETEEETTVLLALSHDIQAARAQLKQATTEADALFHQMNLWWGLLKGFVWSGTRNTTNCYEFAPMLIDHPETTRLIADTLRAATEQLIAANVRPVMWSASRDQTIEDIPTDWLVDDLIAAVDKAAEQREAMRRLR